MRYDFSMLYYTFVAIFTFSFALANSLGGKLLPFPFIHSLFMTSGTLVYPLTFVISDLVTEVYGEKKAKTMVLCGFLASAFVFLVQLAFSMDFRISGILILSSLIAFLAGQLIDIKLFSLIKKWTNGRLLWLRNQLSTYISQVFDTWIVNSLVLFWGLGLSWNSAFPVILGNFLYKMIFTIAAIPVLYISVKKAKAYEI